MHWTSFFIGLASAFPLSALFLAFCAWHNSRYPLVRPLEDEGDTTEQLSRRSTTIHSSPSYGIRVVK